jgi:hypothetical protein
MEINIFYCFGGVFVAGCNRALCYFSKHSAREKSITVKCYFTRTELLVTLTSFPSLPAITLISKIFLILSELIQVFFVYFQIKKGTIVVIIFRLTYS